jgi:hypothetical protein
MRSRKWRATEFRHDKRHGAARAPPDDATRLWLLIPELNHFGLALVAEQA